MQGAVTGNNLNISYLEYMVISQQIHPVNNKSFKLYKYKYKNIRKKVLLTFQPARGCEFSDKRDFPTFTNDSGI